MCDHFAPSVEDIAQRAVARRLARGWTRVELAARAGVAPDTLKRFEQTGQISLARLLAVARVLDADREFAALFPRMEAESVAELAQLRRRHSRKRGVRRAKPTITDL